MPIALAVVANHFQFNPYNMAYSEDDLKEDLRNQEYEFGFTTDIESDKLPAGLDETVIRHISKKKNEPQWLLEYRIKAFHAWQKMDDRSILAVISAPRGHACMHACMLV